MHFPAIDPVAVHLGPLAIRWYALAYIFGILLGWFYCSRLLKDNRVWRHRPAPLNQVQLDDLILWLILGIVLGGRIGYFFFYQIINPLARAELIANPLEAFMIWHGGMSFHGGLIGVSLAIFLFARRHKVSMLAIGDAIAPCVSIGLFFGRLANFINGELWGRPTTLPWGMIFPSAPDALPRHPSQLYEAGLEGVLLFVIMRTAIYSRAWKPGSGAISGLFLICYALFRISLENVRNPDIGFPALPLGLTMGMVLSLPMLALGLYLVWKGMLAPSADATIGTLRPAVEMAGRASEDGLTLMSWNIHSCIGMDGVCDPQRIAAAIVELGCDIYCLQEVGWHLRGTQGVDQFAPIIDSFGGHHYVSLTKTLNAHFGNLIVSKYPISDAQTVPLGRWWSIPRVMQSVSVDVNGTSVRVLNLHMGLDPFERMAQTAIVGKHIRERMARNPDEPILLCGDFNALFNVGSLKNLAGLFDVAHVFKTFPSPRPTLNLDRLYVRKAMNVLVAERLSDQAFTILSDHLPVLAIVQV